MLHETLLNLKMEHFMNEEKSVHLGGVRCARFQ